MAPVPEYTFKTYLTSLLSRTPSPPPPATLTSKLSTLAARARILPRATLTDPGSGVTPPDNIPNKAVFIILGLIGAGFVVTGIWFFFWAKNGGFYFKENDWEDYKSTVLRRKGPNGTTLSGATASTDLGGGSVVHGEKDGSRWGRKKRGMKRYKDFDEESSQVTSSLGGSTLGSEMSELKHKVKKDKKKREKKAKKDKSAVSEAGTVDEELDVGVADAMRAYRHEKPARVGGLNKQPDGSSWDGSNTNDGSTAASDLLSHREHTPTNTPTKVKKERKDTYTGGTGGIRKVVSTSEGGASNFWSRSLGSGSASKKAEEDERIKAEAKKLQEKGRAAQRRDFSFNIGDDSTVVSSEASDRNARREERERRRASRSPTKKVPGSYIDEGSLVGSDLSSDIGTKSYHHPIPGLGSSTGGSEYAEERRKKRNGGGGGGGGGGYRRGRSDSLSE